MKQWDKFNEIRGFDKKLKALGGKKTNQSPWLVTRLEPYNSSSNP